jgi:hypothetical protein
MKTGANITTAAMFAAYLECRRKALMFRFSILRRRKAISLMIFLFASVPWQSRRRPRPRVHPFGNDRILQHDEAQLCGLRHRFGPTVCIKLGEYRSDMKLDGVE